MKTSLALLAALTWLAVAPSTAHAGRLAWAGRVDDTVIIRLHGRDVSTQVISGKGVQNERYFVTGRLHPGAFVTLADRFGRGRIRIVQQPRPFNGFTAAVRIHDGQPGNAPYHFTLLW